MLAVRSARWLAAAPLLAGLSLLAPALPTFDAWSWLIWGRELTELDLDTTAGPSWKPLPVLVTAPLSALLGDAAPDAWLFIVRTAWLLAIGLAGLLAVRLLPERVADAAPGAVPAVAGLAGLSVLLLDDAFTPWLRQVAMGLSEPLLVALALSALLARLAGRGRVALIAVFACSLLRPEAWVLLGLLALERWREGRDRALIVIALAAIPLAWFAPDLLGSGDPLTGASRAREGTGTPPLELLEALWRFALMPLPVLWVGVAFVFARCRSIRGIREAAVAAGIWVGQVALLAAAGYAGLPRFMAPAAAVVCALGAVGLAVAWADLRAGARAGRGDAGAEGREPGRRLRVGAVGPLAVALAITAAAFVAWRTVDLVGDARGISSRVAPEEALVELAVGVHPPDSGMECGQIYVDQYLYGPAIAWAVGVPLRQVRPMNAEAPIRHGIAIFAASDPPRHRVIAGGRPLADGPGTRALGFGCSL